MKKALAFSIALATASMLPHVAHAADPTTQADRPKQAQAFADQAYEAYQRSDWGRAVALYLESYKLVPTAELLYNVASIYDKKLNDRQLAVEYYRRHNASTDTTPDLVVKATARIAELSQPEKSSTDPQPGGQANGKPAPAPAPDEPPSNPGAAMRTVGVITGVVGLVGLGVGTGFGLSASSQHSDAKKAGCSGSTCPDSASADKEKSASSAATLSTIGFIAGGVLLATGITLFIAAPSGNKEKTAIRISPAVGPTTAGITLSGVMF